MNKDGLSFLISMTDESQCPRLASCPAAIADLLEQQYSLGHANWLQDPGEQVASIWLDRDKAAARAWIEQAPLPDEAKQRLFKP